MKKKLKQKPLPLSISKASIISKANISQASIISKANISQASIISQANISQANISGTTLLTLPCEMIEYICMQIPDVETLIQFYIALDGFDREKKAVEYILRRTTLAFTKPALARLARIPAKQLTHVPTDIFYHLLDNTKISFYAIGNLLKDHTKQNHSPDTIMWAKHLHAHIGHVRKNWHIVNIITTYAIEKTVRKEPIIIYDRVDGYNLFSVQELFFHPLYPVKKKARQAFLALCNRLSHETMIKYVDTLIKYLLRFDNETHPLYDEPHVQYTINMCKTAQPLVETVMRKYLEGQTITEPV